MGRGVAVSEAEPVGLDAVRRELLLDDERLVLASPPALGADAAAEGVHHGVEIGAHAQTEEPDVIAGVADDGHRRVAPFGGVRRTEVVEKASGEPGTADTTREHRDAHGGDPVIRPDSCPKEVEATRAGDLELVRLS